MSPALALLFCCMTDFNPTINEGIEAWRRYEARATNVRFDGESIANFANGKGITSRSVATFTFKHRPNELYLYEEQHHEQEDLNNPARTFKRFYGVEGTVSPQRFYLLNFEKKPDLKVQVLRTRSTGSELQDFGLLAASGRFMLIGLWSGPPPQRASEFLDSYRESITPGDAPGSFRLECEWGVYEWQVDPATGLPSYLRQVVELGNSYWQLGTVKEIRGLDEQGGYLGKESTWKITPTEITSESTSKYKDRHEQSSRIIRYRMQPLPADDPLDLTLPIPDQTRGWMVDDPKIDYEVRGGKVEKKYSRAFVAFADSLKSDFGGPDWLTWILGGGVALALMAGAFWWLRMRGTA